MCARARQGRAGKAAVPWPELPPWLHRDSPRDPLPRDPVGSPPLGAQPLPWLSVGPFSSPRTKVPGGSEISSLLIILSASCPTTRRTPSLGQMGGMG